MKKTIVLFLLFISLLSFSQQISRGNQSLLDKLLEIEKKDRENIEKYIDDNPNLKRRFISEGITYELFKIKNGAPVYVSTSNIHSAISTKTNRLYPGGELGLNLTGAGYTVGVWDSGVLEKEHDEFVPDNGNIKVEVEPFKDKDDHATHVSGTIAGLGKNSAAKGMSYESNIKSFDWNEHATELINAANDSENPIYFSNHSYGIPIFNDNTQQLTSDEIGAYTATASYWDNIAFQNENLLIVTSAGNEGLKQYEGGMLPNFDKLTERKTSKNNVVVANAQTQYAPLSQELISFSINSSSSQGPTNDLRVKPDITGDGTQVYSSITNNSYDTYTGTSMASPNVCGSLVLVHQHFVNTLNYLPLASTIKGIMCHTAIDDNTWPGPDPVYGWGLLDSKASVEIINASLNESEAFILEKKIINGSVYEKYITIDGNTEKLSASLSWTDPGGIAYSSGSDPNIPAIINDLDIRIEKDNEVFYPWKLQMNSTDFSAIKSVNDVDNLERIDINFPEKGIYKVIIEHKGDLQNPNQPPLEQPKYQKYSLIISGDNIDFSLNLNKVEMDNFMVYPNPVKTGTLYISGVSSGDLIQVRNIAGQIVWEGKIFEGTIDVSHLTKGFYFILSHEMNKIEKILIK